MARVKCYLDVRYARNDGTCPVKIMFSHRGTTAFMGSDIFVPKKNWDSVKNKVIGTYPGKNAINDIIQQRLVTISQLVAQLSFQYKNATGLRDAVEVELSGGKKEDVHTFYESFLSFVERHSNERTRQLYWTTWNAMKKYCVDAESLTFEDITKTWLMDFDSFLSATNKKNSRNIHLRNIRAVFNDAIDDELTTAYPFRKLKIRPQKTAKRSLTVEQLRQLFTFEPDEDQRQYLDMFRLIFLLIGINIADLCKLDRIKGGRVEYNRAKTGRFYSIKVEPEAEAIINRYMGKSHLLNIMDRYANYKDYAKRLNLNLKRIGPVETGRRGMRMYHPLFPELTTYWARHTWATVAAKLEIPKETIAAALGHGGDTVTDIYIDFDQRKVDEANRRVIDYVLYGKDEKK